MEFTVQANWGGKSWCVLCVTGYGVSIEILETFLSQDAAQQWINTKSGAWTAARRALD